MMYRIEIIPTKTRSMPYASSNPLSKIDITRLREQASILLPPLLLRLLLRRRGSLPINSGSSGTNTTTCTCTCSVPLLLRLRPSSLAVQLALLAVEDQESQRAGQADYDQALNEAVLDEIAVNVVTTRDVLRGGLEVFVLLVEVRMVVLQKVVEPFSEGPFLRWFCVAGGQFGLYH